MVQYLSHAKMFMVITIWEAPLEPCSSYKIFAQHTFIGLDQSKGKIVDRSSYFWNGFIKNFSWIGIALM